MPGYHLETAHFLDGIWYPAGADIDWSGPPSRHMVPSAEWAEKRKARAERGGGPENRGRVVSNPNANPPTVRGNIMPAKESMAGPEAPSKPAGDGQPQDERNPNFVPPTGSRPISPGADEAAQVSGSAPAKAPDGDKPKPAPVRAKRTTDPTKADRAHRVEKQK
jgi:hypothetical protein